MAVVGTIALVVHTANVFSTRPPQSSRMIASVTQRSSPKTLLVEQIQTDPTIAQRLSVLPNPRWQKIDDDELIQSLANAGQPARGS